MAGILLRTPWRPGQQDGADGPVLISVTDFRLNAARDLPGAYLAAMRLRRAWPDLEGAIGLWLWAKPLQLRSGSVSVWRSEEDLARFVRWPVHVAIMRKYRGAGRLTSQAWLADRFVAPQIWRDAARLLTGGDVSAHRAPDRRGG